MDLPRRDWTVDWVADLYEEEGYAVWNKKHGFYHSSFSATIEGAKETHLSYLGLCGWRLCEEDGDVIVKVTLTMSPEDRRRVCP